MKLGFSLVVCLLLLSGCASNKFDDKPNTSLEHVKLLPLVMKSGEMTSHAVAIAIYNPDGTVKGADVKMNSGEGYGSVGIKAVSNVAAAAVNGVAAAGEIADAINKDSKRKTNLAAAEGQRLDSLARDLADQQDGRIAAEGARMENLTRDLADQAMENPPGPDTVIQNFIRNDPVTTAGATAVTENQSSLTFSDLEISED